MISHLLEQNMFDQSKKTNDAQLKRNLLNRKINMQQLEIATPTQLTQNHSITRITHGLQKLLKTSPYATLVKQRSQQQIHIQDSFTQQYPSIYTPTSQNSHLPFKSDLKSLNSTNSSSIKQRIKNSIRTLPKRSFDVTQLVVSHREKDQQTIQSLQAVLLRTSNILQVYKQEIKKYAKENEELKAQIEIMKSYQ